MITVGKSGFLAGIITAIVLLAGCSIVYTTQPIYFKNDIVVNSDLIGIWAEDESSREYIEIKADGPDSYLISIGDSPGKRVNFSAHLVNIDGFLFLDLLPAAGPETASPRNLHITLMVDGIGNSLSVSRMETEWLIPRLEVYPGLIDHKKNHGLGDDAVVITAATGEIQEFLITYRQLFGERLILYKLLEPPAPAPESTHSTDTSDSPEPAESE